jgi:hypothetical protein
MLEFVQSSLPVNPSLNDDSSLFVMGAVREMESSYNTILLDESGEPATSSTPQPSRSPWPACALVMGKEQDQEVREEVAMEEGKEEDEQEKL